MEYEFNSDIREFIFAITYLQNFLQIASILRQSKKNINREFKKRDFL